MSSVSVSMSVPHGGRLGSKTHKTTHKTMRKLVDQLHSEDVAMQAHLHKVLGWLEAEDTSIKARTDKFIQTWRYL